MGDIRIEAAHVGYLSRATLERLTCDCEISRVITDGDGVIIDVGRATRNISDALWKALVVRDQHCTEPGCHQPPGVCEAHHIGTGKTAAPPTSPTSNSSAGPTTENTTSKTPKPAPDNSRAQRCPRGERSCIAAR